MESLGGLSLQQISSLLLARFDLSGGRRDLLWQWMLDGQRVWRFISASVSLPSFLFFCSLSLVLAPRPDGSEPPPPPSLFFRSIPQSPDLVLHERDLMESLGGLSLQQISSLLLARFDLSGGRRDLLWRSGHWLLGLFLQSAGVRSSFLPCVVVFVVVVM
uniref:Uncharacterized protein n=1 Tax=Fagus sylvatica TaxID=28930 RepID=A0A2N9H7R9_FAGSY